MGNARIACRAGWGDGEPRAAVSGPVNCIRYFGDVIHLESNPDPFVFLLWYLKNVDGPQCLVSFQATTGSRCFLVRYERDVAVAYADFTS